MPKKKLEPIVKEAEFTEVVDGQDVGKLEGVNPGGQTLDLNNVAFMLAIGRYKDGNPFCVPVNVNDIFTIRGMIDYAEEEISEAWAKFFEARKAAEANSEGDAK